MDLSCLVEEVLVPLVDQSWEALLPLVNQSWEVLFPSWEVLVDPSWASWVVLVVLENLSEAEMSIGEAVKLLVDMKDIIGNIEMSASTDSDGVEVEEENSTSSDEIIDKTDKATTSEQELNG